MIKDIKIHTAGKSHPDVFCNVVIKAEFEFEF